MIYWFCFVWINENVCKVLIIEKDGIFNGGKNMYNYIVEGECNSKDLEVDYVLGLVYEVNCIWSMMILK